MNPILTIGTQAVREAAKLLVRSMEHLESIDIKAEDRRRFTAELKRLATEEMIAIIHKSHPSHSVTTEDARDLGTQGEACWMIDAISGETNFMHGLPHFAISVAIKLQNKITAGLIYDFLRDELFIASQGQGARLNSRRLRVSQTKKLSAALIGTSDSLNLECQAIRNSGCAALDLAYVAAARLDAFYLSNANIPETSAGLLLVTEAGGKITHDKKNLIASNSKLPIS